MCSEDVQVSLCDLPHYTLSILLSYLDSNSLYMLSQTCTFLRDCVEDPKFWKYIDARRAPNDIQKFRYCEKRIWEQTTHLLLRGTGMYNTPRTFFIKMKPFRNLKILALEHQRIMGEKISIRTCFPSGLEEISLKGTYIENKSFFQQSWYKFPKLKVLILDECDWLGCDALMSLSKYESLEIVSVVRCLKVHIDTVPYASIARYGFNKLKIFDGRFTGIGGEFLRTFYGHESIQRFYFQSFHSAVIDYGPDCGGNSKKIFKGTGTCQNISDSNLRDYASTESLEEVDSIFDSFLYRDPYPSCTCGGRDRDMDDGIGDLPVLKDDCLDNCYDSDDIRIVCRKHRKEMENLPQDVRDALIRTQRLDLASALDNEPDSGEDDPNCCCLHGMDTKVIILSNINNLATISLPEGAPERGFNPNIIYLHFGNSRNGTDNANRRSEVIDNNEPSTSNNVETNSQNSIEENPSTSQDRSNEQPSTSRSTSEDSNMIEIELNNSENSLTDESARNVGNMSKRKQNENESNLAQPSNKKRKSTGSEPSTSGNNVLINKNLNDNMDDESSEEENIDFEFESDNIALNISRYFQVGQQVEQPNPQQNVDAQPNPEPQPNVALPRQENIPFYLKIPSRYAYGNAIRILRERVPAGVKKKISLNRLSLRGYKKITDISLDYLKHLNIDLLDLTYSSVSKEGIENFLSYHPNCRIIHPFYCICKPRSPF